MGLRGPGASRQRKAKKPRALDGSENSWKEEGISRLEAVTRFIESLPITKGKLAGTNMSLLPDQKEFLARVYGEREIPVRIAIKSEPRGNGKTGLLAGISLCHLLGPESEQRGEVYSAAIDRQQAGIMFNEMEAIILRRPDFAVRTNIQRFHKRIEVIDEEGEGSIYEALSSDARRAHGLAPSLWVYDELAQAKDRVLLDNLMTAMGKRDRALGIIISTQAPDEEHPLSQLIDDAENAPDQVVDLLSAPETDNPFDPEVIRSVNPALGIFLDEGDVFAEAERAKRLPAFESAFRNLRLNQRVHAGEEERLVTVPVWKTGAVPIDLEKLKGKECFAGLDLSGKTDLTALVLVFPDGNEQPNYDIVPFFWTPEGQLSNRPPGEEERLRDWVRRDFIECIPGPIIRYAWVANKIRELSELYKIRVIAYDRWRIDDLKAELTDPLAEGLPFEPFGQGHSKVMAPAIEFFIECALTGRLRHGGHPVLTASVVNAVVIPDTSGNPKLDKSKKRGPVRIDGAVALVMALGTAHRFEGAEPEYQMLVF